MRPMKVFEFQLIYLETVILVLIHTIYIGYIQKYRYVRSIELLKSMRIIDCG